MAESQLFDFDDGKQQLTEAEQATVAPFFKHTGRLTPTIEWQTLHANLKPGSGTEARQRLLAAREEIQAQLGDRLNAWLAPGPLSYELRQHGSAEGAVEQARDILYQHLGETILFCFN